MEFISQNLDAILKIVVITFGAFGFYYALRNDISSVKADVAYIKENQKSLAEAFTQLGKILTQVAVQDMRLNMIEKRIDEHLNEKA